ncbi:hypothetical protein PFICI_11086 [Pestalotiopsis fici W106-1]|uniref:Xaa-Pro dipeptidyl-peptidase C-terminal domain-containing protein n=1 Tax=Pestalotiopsis fici (strain W106-1 / CGMCC3.15140) TaxID=1229662 RepID=W3WVR1_PESFW|nr:uncharacterized protein PFICI_11086 [Pestalotiopsis fici W106-1]ETS77212.1 hypothetical protein PFICI_11086 [Pestalotiopsis fici W106-1]
MARSIWSRLLPNALSLITILPILTDTSLAGVNGSEAAVEIVQGPSRVYGNDSYPTIWRRVQDLEAPRARYPGFQPQTLVLKNGTIRREGARPLMCDILFERDVPVALRDGSIMYTDVFRPTTGPGPYPAIVAWSPYGKEVGGQWLDDTVNRTGVALSTVSELQKFEGPDPAYWVNQGYVVLNADARGAYSSEGNITTFGRQLAEDGYDFIEWVAAQPWSSGKVGMSGNSWLAISQWFIAAEQPPHLTAIAPWEGLTDLFRDVSNRGGSPAPGFQEIILTAFGGKNYAEDIPRMCVNEILMNEYWEDKIAQVENISIPAYVVASYTNELHTHGSFDGFRRIQSTEKWLRVHNSSEWPDYYESTHVEELTSFFDYFLKEKVNGWSQTPRIRISILDPSQGDTVDQAEDNWPVTNVVPRTMYLQANNTLADDTYETDDSVSYNASSTVGTTFTYDVDEALEIIGYMKLRLWVEAEGSDDMELSITVQKLDHNGNPYESNAGVESSTIVGASGKLRVSQRAIDETRSTPFEPYLLHTSEQLLQSGDIVPVEIGVWPMALRVHPDEKIAVTVAPAPITPTNADLGYGTARILVPRSGGTYPPGQNVSTIILGGNDYPDYVNEQRVATPITRNNGTHVIHFGGQYDSYLLMPVRYINQTNPRF